MYGSLMKILTEHTTVMKKANTLLAVIRKRSGNKMAGIENVQVQIPLLT